MPTPQLIFRFLFSRLFQTDWKVPVVTNLLPGKDGVMLTTGQQQVCAILESLKGSTANACLVALDKVDSPGIKQSQHLVNVGMKQGSGLVVRHSLAWIIQVGENEILPVSGTTTPKRDSSIVSALVAYRDSISAELSKSLQDKKLTLLREQFEKLLSDAAAAKLDFFKLREDCEGWFCLVRTPMDYLHDLLRTSGHEGIFLRSRS